ncbi:TlpA family protein disulfide reductase [bacterium]|nr:TlpA family protein disulfide reductase [bacterium]
MKQRIILFSLLLVGFGVYIYLNVIDNKIANPEGDLPIFSLESESGPALTSQTLHGKKILIHFWASYCYPCVQEIPKLNAYREELKKQNIELVAISLDEKKEDVVRFRQKVKFDFPVYFDPEYKLVDYFHTTRLPESFLVDENGKVINSFIGAQEWGQFSVTESL